MLVIKTITPVVYLYKVANYLCTNVCIDYLLHQASNKNNYTSCIIIHILDLIFVSDDCVDKQ